MTQVTVNSNTYSDDGSTSKDMQYGGFRENLLPMVSDTMVDTAAKVAAAANQAAIATNQANIAIGAAASTVTGPGSTGTSTTSLTVGLGSKSLTIQTGKTLYPGMPIVIAASASPQDAMYGPLISYNSATGAMVVQVTNINTTTPGTFITAAAWTVSLSGPAGVTGVLHEFKGADIPCAATINLGAATGNFLHITGATGPVTAITVPLGSEYTVVWDAAPTINHNATTLILPTGAPITVAAGDTWKIRGDTGGARVVDIQRADGRAVFAPYALGSPTVATPLAAATLDVLNFVVPGANGYFIEIEGLLPASGSSELDIRFANAGTVDAGSNYRTGTGGATTQTSVSLSAGSASVSGVIEIQNANSASQVKSVYYRTSNDAGSVFNGTTYIGGAISGIRLFWGNGQNFAPQGAVRIYPILNA